MQRPVKSVTIAFLGNIDYDTRTSNLVASFKEICRSVVFIGFDWLTPGFTESHSPEKHVIRLRKGRFSILFYLRFVVTLTAYLCRNRADLFIASDIYSLPSVVLCGRLVGATIMYDSREIFTEVSGIQHRKVLQKLFGWIERLFITSVNHVVVTGEMDAEYLKKVYGLTSVEVLRNLPRKNIEIRPVDLHARFSIPPEKKIILYQGMIVKGRGIDTYIKAITSPEDFVLLMLGTGEHLEYYTALVASKDLQKKVVFGGRVPQSELLHLIPNAFSGLAMIENISFNNYYALPNKMFEYIMCGVPVIVSNLPQMKKIVDRYAVGECLDENDAEGLAKTILEWQRNQIHYLSLKENCRNAAKELNWETEFDIFKKNVLRLSVEYS
jgi:glycosyltransferase involved in cell wall biosynthesis